MKIPHSSQRNGRGITEINMTPMIDMVFLLIVYFVWTSGDAASELLLPTRISEQAGTSATAADEPPPAEADFDPVVVRIAAAESETPWRVNGQPVASLVELRDILERLAEITRTAPVILHPDPETPLEEVVDVYDLVRVIGFEKVQFTASHGS